LKNLWLNNLILEFLRNINTSQFEKVYRINQNYSEQNYAAIEQKESFKLGVQLCKSQWNKMKI